MGGVWYHTQMDAIVSAPDLISMKKNYYLEKSTSVTDDTGTTYYGASGAVEQDSTYEVASFTSFTSQLGNSADAMAGKSLIEALNAWVSSADNTYDATQ